VIIKAEGFAYTNYFRNRFVNYVCLVINGVSLALSKTIDEARFLTIGRISDRCGSAILEELIRCGGIEIVVGLHMASFIRCNA
jgi:hypothetical protein